MVRTNFIYSRVCSLFLISLIFLSVFGVGVRAQSTPAVDLPVANPTTSTADSAVITNSPTVPSACFKGQVMDFVARSCVASGDVGKSFDDGVGPGRPFLYFMDRFRDRMTKTPGEYTAERINEMKMAIAGGDYNSAAKVVPYVTSGFERMSADVNKQFGDAQVTYGEWKGESPGYYSDFRDYRYALTQNVGEFSAIKYQLASKVADGTVTKEQANAVIDGADETITDTVVAEAVSIDERFAEEIVGSSNDEINRIDVIITSEVDSRGQGANRYNFNVPAIVGAKNLRLDALESSLMGRAGFNSEQLADFSDKIAQARLELQLGGDLYSQGFESDAVGSLSRIGLLISALENVDDSRDLLAVNDYAPAQSVEELNDEIIYESRQTLEDVSEASARLLDEFPVESHSEVTSGLVAIQERSEMVVSIANKIEEIKDAEVEKLKWDGLNVDGAQRIVSGKVADELYYVHGGRYVPEGFVTMAPYDDGTVGYSYGSGFPKGVDYIPFSGEPSVRFGETGYSWNSWAGGTYNTDYPSNYNPQAFERGDEVFTDIASDGSRVDRYATGYRVVGADGSVETFSYSEQTPRVTFVDGSVVSYGQTDGPHDYTVTFDGRTTVWVGNPAFHGEATDGQSDGRVVYIDTATGKSFVNGASHLSDAEYDTQTRTYSFSVGPQEWRFNSEKNSFSTPDKSVTVTPPVPTAPVGLVLSGESLTTADGTTWESDSTGTVLTEKNLKGESKDIVLAPNQIARSDSDGEGYIDFRGEEVDEVVLGDKIWEQTGSRVWATTDGSVVYDPVSGKTAGADGGEDLSGNYGSVVDSSGKVIERNTYSYKDYVYNPLTGRPEISSRAGMPSSQPVSGMDVYGNTWTRDVDGRYYTNSPSRDKSYYATSNQYSFSAGVAGTTYTVGSRAYIQNEKGEWTNSDGTSVSSRELPSGGQYTSSYNGGGYYRGDVRSPVGTRVVADDGKEYFVDSSKGWAMKNNAGNVVAVAPPRKDGVQMPSSAGGYAYAYGDYGKGYGYYSNGVGSTSEISAGAVRVGADGQTYTKTDAGDWKRADGTSVGNYPGYVSTVPGYGGYSIGGVYGASSGGYITEMESAARAAGYSSAAAGYEAYAARAGQPPSSYNPANTAAYTGSGWAYNSQTGGWEASTGGYASGTSGGGYYVGGSMPAGYGGTPYSSYTGGYYGPNDPAGPNYAGSTYGGYGYMAPSSGAYAGYASTSGYTGSTYGCANGACGGATYYSPSSSGTYVAPGTSYPSGGYYDPSGTYIASSSGTYTGTTSGTYSGTGGTYYSPEGTSSSSGSTGGESGTTSGTTSGGEGGSSGGSTSGGEGGGGTTGGVISEDGNVPTPNGFVCFFRILLGVSC